MSILCPASSQAMSTVRRRGPSPVSNRVRTFRVATTSGRCFTDVLDFCDRVLDNPVTAGGHSGKVEKLMFMSLFLGPSFTGTEQCGL